jgi:hypothetical protein
MEGNTRMKNNSNITNETHGLVKAFGDNWAVME